MRENWRGMYSHMDTIDAPRSRGPAGVERGQGSCPDHPTKRRAVIVVIILVLHILPALFYVVRTVCDKQAAAGFQEQPAQISCGSRATRRAAELWA